MRTLYDRFFLTGLPAHERAPGIVFARRSRRDHSQRGRRDAHACQPGLGTGRGHHRALRRDRHFRGAPAAVGCHPAEALERKYKHEIFANEFVLLSLLHARRDHEQVYHQVRAEVVDVATWSSRHDPDGHPPAARGDGTITEDF